MFPSRYIGTGRMIHTSRNKQPTCLHISAWSRAVGVAWALHLWRHRLLSPCLAILPVWVVASADHAAVGGGAGGRGQWVQATVTPVASSP